MTRGKELILHSTAFTGVGDKGGFIPIILRRYTDGKECKGCIVKLSVRERLDSTVSIHCNLHSHD
jgi:hypothetical protein